MTMNCQEEPTFKKKTSPFIDLAVFQSGPDDSIDTFYMLTHSDSVIACFDFVSGGSRSGRGLHVDTF